SLLHATVARFAFDEGARVLADAEVDSNESPHMDIHDLLDVFNLDRTPYGGKMVPDPRGAEIRGRAAGKAKIHFALGGREDRCGGGLIRVDGDFRLLSPQLYGERFDGGDLELGLVWDDREAGANGMKLDVRSAVLRKGTGSITAFATVRH